MLWLSELACKFSFYLLSCLAIPCIFEMETLLTLWLGKVPEYAVLFCRMVLIASIVDSLTCGLGMANQAIGNIKQYSLAVNSVKLITLPVAFICVKIGLSIYWIAISYVIFEFLCAMIRLPFVKRTGGLNVLLFIKNVFIKASSPFIVFILTTYVLSSCFKSKFAFILTFTGSSTIYTFAIYLLGLTVQEKAIIKGMCSSLKTNVIKILKNSYDKKSNTGYIL